MRLALDERQGILKVLNSHGEVRLCGSRIDDDARGGDIDLMLIVRNEGERDALLNRKHFLLSELKAILTDQRIDLTITTPERVSRDPVLESMLETSIEI